MANKAIIGLESWGVMRARAIKIARRVDAGEAVPEADYHLNFATTAQLFDELTPARLALLEILKGLGSVSIHALAKHLERNYRDVHADINKLLELGLVEKNAAGKVFVPWEEIQIRVTLGGAAAA